MRHWKGAVALVAVAAVALIAGCGRQVTGPSVESYAEKRQAASEGEKEPARQASSSGEAAAGEEAGGFGVRRSDYVYDPIGKRDPFRSFVLERVAEEENEEQAPLEQFDLSQLSVTGVIWNADRLRALVQDPSGRSYIVGEGDPMGKNNGRVVRIGNSAVLVREAYVDFHGEKTTKEIEMRVRKSEGG